MLSRALVQMQEALTENGDIRRSVADARMHRVGSPAWWRAVMDALDAYFTRLAGGQRALAEYRRWAEPSQWEELGRQWRAVMDVCIGDVLLQAQHEDMTCQLCCQFIPTDNHHHVIDADRVQVLCACQDCRDKAERMEPGQPLV